MAIKKSKLYSSMRFFQKLFQKIVEKIWIRPLVDLMRFNICWDDRGQLNKLILNALVWLKDLGVLLSTLGKANIKKLEGESWSVIYVGYSNHPEKDIDLFPSPPKMTQLGVIFVWKIGRALPRLMQGADMVVCDLNRHLNFCCRCAKYIFRSPKWIGMRVAVKAPLNEILARMSSGRKDQTRKVLKEALFTYELSHSLSDLELFYYKMHLPYCTNRFGKRADIRDWSLIKKIFKKGNLFIIKFNNEKVAGMIGYPVKSSYILHTVGIHEQYFHLLDQGVFIAADWFAIEWANKNGFNWLDLMGANPLLSNGVFWGKYSVGSQVRRSFLESTYRLFVSKGLTDSFRNFINESGFIAEDGDKYRLVVLKEDKHSNFIYPEKEKLRLERISKRLGLGEFLTLPL